jgi:hypothetical protein
MRGRAPFRPEDLQDLDERLLQRADRVVPMRDVWKGDRGEKVIGLRHDVDDNPYSFETALAFAGWEFERGYSSTYFLLHGSHYWDEEMFVQVERFVDLGHEVGIHCNAIAEGLLLNRDPHRVFSEALHELRSTGVRISGVVAHGDSLCHEVGFVNDEMFVESRRSNMGAPDRVLSFGRVHRKIETLPRSVYEIEYDPNWVPRGMYLSDSGGKWSQPFGEVVERFGYEGQLHVLIHPDWWVDAFAGVTV